MVNRELSPDNVWENITICNCDTHSQMFCCIDLINIKYKEGNLHVVYTVLTVFTVVKIG